MNTTIDLLNKRISLRKFLDTPISKEHEDQIIECAMRAPTAGNMMLYSIIAIRDEDKRKQLSETCDHQPFITNAPLALIFVADYKKLYDYYKLSGVKDYLAEKGEAFIGPTCANIMLASSDALIAAQNAAIAAEALGIGSCYIGDIMENVEQHRDILHLPEYVFPIAMLVLGYYPPEVSRTPKFRFKKQYVVFDEAYRTLSEAELTDLFSEWDKRYSSDNRFHAKNIGQFHYSSKTKADFSIEMERSVKEYLKQWNGDEL